jgi:hypothetical protein
MCSVKVLLYLRDSRYKSLWLPVIFALVLLAGHMAPSGYTLELTAAAPGHGHRARCVGR